MEVALVHVNSPELLITLGTIKHPRGSPHFPEDLLPGHFLVSEMHHIFIQVP